MSVKLNQPFTLVLTISTTSVIENATSSYLTYITPSGTTGTLSTTVLDTTAKTITYSFSTGIVNEVNEWKFVPWIKSSDGNTYPMETYELNVLHEFSTD